MELSAADLLRSFPELHTANVPRAAIVGVQMFVAGYLAWRVSLAYVLRPFHAARPDDRETRARRLYAGQLCFVNSYVVGIVLTLVWLMEVPISIAPYRGPAFDRPYLVLGFLGWGLAWLIAGGAFYRLRTGRSMSLVEAWHAFAFDVVCDPLLLLGLPLLALVSDRLDGPTFAALGAAAAIYLAYRVGLGHALLRRFGTIRPVEEPWAGILARVAAASGVLDLTVWRLRCSHANVFAMPGHNVYFAESLFAELDEADFEALLWHEVAHVRESLIDKWLRHGAIPLLLILNAGPAVVGQWGLRGILPVFVLLYFAQKLLVRHSRRLEIAADAYGRAQTSVGAYAVALRKLHRLALIPESTGMKNITHPDLRERVAVDLAEPPGEPQSPTGTIDKRRAYLGLALYIACFLGALACGEWAINASR